MRNVILSIYLAFLGGCALTPSRVPNAPRDQAKAVVFDIDGTLTPRRTQVWKARDDAAKTVQIFADQGYQVIYLSARSRFNQKSIPGFLLKNGFPQGSIMVPETAEDGRDHARFKTRILKEFEQNGWHLQYAFGDSSTDFEAYARAGIPRKNVFALKRKGSSTCEKGPWEVCLPGWTEYAGRISN